MIAWEVIIADPGGRNPRRVPVVAPQASWEMNRPGSFSSFARVDDLRAAGLGYDLQDRWITWHGPFGLSWSGVITGRPIDDGIAEIEAEGWAFLLGGHLLTEFERVPDGGPGGLARRAVQAAGASGPTYIGIGLIDEGGTPLSMTFGGQDVLDVLADLSSDGSCEWYVDQDRTFHCARKLGRDKSASIRLIEDIHVVHYRIAEDAWAAPPDEIWAFETPEESARRRYRERFGTMTGLDPQLSLVSTIPEAHRNTARTSSGKRKSHRRRRRGRHHHPHKQNKQHRGHGGGGANATTPSPTPHWAVLPHGIGANNPGVPSGHQQYLPTTPMGLTVVNVDDLYRRVGLGDTVTVLLGTPGFLGKFRILNLAYDASERELHLSGEALEAA